MPRPILNELNGMRGIVGLNELNGMSLREILNETNGMSLRAVLNERNRVRVRAVIFSGMWTLEGVCSSHNGQSMVVEKEQRLGRGGLIDGYSTRIVLGQQAPDCNPATSPNVGLIRPYGLPRSIGTP